LSRAGACAIDNGGCHQNASCTLTVGGNVECSCNQCFEGDGLNCTRTYGSTSQNAVFFFVGVSVRVVATDPHSKRNLNETWMGTERGRLNWSLIVKASKRVDKNVETLQFDPS